MGGWFCDSERTAVETDEEPDGNVSGESSIMLLEEAIGSFGDERGRRGSPLKDGATAWGREPGTECDVDCPDVGSC